MNALERYTALQKLNPNLADIHRQAHAVEIQLLLQQIVDATPAPAPPDLPPIPLFDRYNELRKKNEVLGEVFRQTHAAALNAERDVALAALAAHAAVPDAPPVEEPAT